MNDMACQPYYNSPRWSAEVTDCAMPVTFDQYSRCGYGCLYCFSAFRRSKGNCKADYLGHKVNHINVDSVMSLFLNPGRSKNFGPYISARKVLQWGGLSDPFCPYERKYGVGLQILQLLKNLEYPVCFSTKGVWWLHDEKYRSLFVDADFWNVKFSIITGDASLARAIEPGVAPPAKRLRAIETYSKLNRGGATLRLRPFVPGVSNGSYEQLIRDAASAGATAVSTEFLCLDGRAPGVRSSYESISKLAGFDVFRYYREHSINSGYYRLNRKIKRDIFHRMRQLCDDLGVRFYVSDAHFKELSDDGCCCGLPESWNYSRGQFTEAVVKCRKTGSVNWSDISHDMEHMETTRCVELNLGTDCRAKFVGKNMKQYLHYLWNHPKEARSPYRSFEGIMVPEGKDENGDLIYHFNQDRS